MCSTAVKPTGLFVSFSGGAFQSNGVVVTDKLSNSVKCTSPTVVVDSTVIQCMMPPRFSSEVSDMNVTVTVRAS